MSKRLIKNDKRRLIMGIKKFFQNAFKDMKESAKVQHEVDKAEF